MIAFELIIIILGLFVSFAFGIIAGILRKCNLGIGIWPLLSTGSLFITASEFFRSIVHNLVMYKFCAIVGMIIMFFAALIKYWDIMELTQ